jgi:hypothetical protein
MIGKYLKGVCDSGSKTLLGVGPMSKNCVDAALDLALKTNIPIMLIASRRQVDCEEFGGGYVNNWTTESFCNYIVRNSKPNVILARDHGGPWQNNKEVDKRLTIYDAMLSAKRSYLSDIKAGIKIIHIDPSIDIHRKPTQLQVLERVFELYEYCWSESQKLGLDIEFEVGTEEQTAESNSLDEFEFSLDAINKFCHKNKIKAPLFAVAQTGTKVMECENIGTFSGHKSEIESILKICAKYCVMLKEHNADYLNVDLIKSHPKLGIHAANVAPEFGVTETMAYIKLLKDFNLSNYLEDFLEISYESKKWLKWMKEDTKASDFDKSVISGHYIFSTQEFLENKYQVQKIIGSALDVDLILKKAIEISLIKYAKNFNLM